MSSLWLIGLAAALLITVTYMPILKLDHWVVRVMDFPRLQIAILLCVVLALELAFFDLKSSPSFVLILLTLSAVIYQLKWIVPYSPFFSKEVKSTKKANKTQDTNGGFTLTLLSTNVLMTNRNSEGVLKLIRKYDPDIVVTLETNGWWQTQLKPLEERFTYTMQCALENLYGMHVYSKIELKHGEIKFLVEDDKPSMHAAITLPDGKLARLHFLHPAPPSPTENAESSERDAELLVLAEQLRHSDDPVIVAGDLNDVAWSRTTRAFLAISGLLDPRIGRGTFNTFHTQYWFLRWPLDHLFHSHHFTLDGLKRLPDIGSDHFPLLSTLRYDPKHHQPVDREIDQQEREWAQDKIREEDVSEEDVPNPAKA